MKSAKKLVSKPPAPSPPAKSKGTRAGKPTAPDPEGPRPPTSPRNSSNPRSSIGGEPTPQRGERAPSILHAAPPAQRRGTSQKKRPDNNRHMTTDKLSGDKAASEALRMLHNRLFGAIEESEGKTRQDIQNDTRDGYAKLLTKFGKGWSKAKRAEENARAVRELQRLSEELDAEERDGRSSVEAAEDGRIVYLEREYRETTRTMMQMDSRNREQAAERDSIAATEGSHRREIHVAERMAQGVFEAEYRAALAEATRRHEARIEADRERRRLRYEKVEEERKEVLSKERRVVTDAEGTSRADIDITETYAFELVQERWAKVLAVEAKHKKLVADLLDVERQEAVSRQQLENEDTDMWTNLPDQAADDRVQRLQDGVARHGEERGALEREERKKGLSLYKQESTERADLDTQLRNGVTAFTAWMKKRKDQRGAVSSSEEAERRDTLKEEYNEFLQLGVDRETHHQTVRKILRAQKEADDRSLAEYLADAQNMQLQLEMLANKRKERTEQLKKEREVVVEAVARAEADLEKGELELLMEKWVNSLLDLYLVIDAKSAANEAIDEDVQAYSGDKLMFAMQLSQFKRSNPTNYANTGPATRGRMTALIRPFLELLVRDGDTNRTNMTLMNTLLADNLPIDFGRVIEEDKLMNDAAVDGSVSYVDAFLSRTDLKLAPEAAASLVTIGLNNPTKQILFAECFLRREFALDMMALREDLSTIWQEFFFRCVTRSQDGSPGASQRNYVVQTMLGRMGSSIGISLTVPSHVDGDMQGHTPVTALCRRGDVELFQIILNKCDPQQVAESLVVPTSSDRTTPLINSILANDEDAVRLLLQFSNVRDQIRPHRSDMGTAEDVVERVLATEEIIVEMVLQCGAGGDAPDVLNATASTLGQLSTVQDLAATMSVRAPPQMSPNGPSLSPNGNDFFESPAAQSLGRLSGISTPDRFDDMEGLDDI